VLDEHAPNLAGPVAEALERLRSTAANTSLTIFSRDPSSEPPVGLVGSFASAYRLTIAPALEELDASVASRCRAEHRTAAGVVRPDGRQQTVGHGDQLTSPLLPGFAVDGARVFPT
jgi:hypothetical protein